MKHVMSADIGFPKRPPIPCVAAYIKIPRSGRLHLRNLFLLPEGVRSRKHSDHQIEKGERRELLSDPRQPGGTFLSSGLDQIFS